LRWWLCGILSDYRGVIGEGCLELDASRGVISRISKEPPSGALVEDYRGKGFVVAPGFIDLHVHLRGLNLSYKEDEVTGCRAAAAGGVTLVVDMPNTSPPLTTPEALDAKLAALGEGCIVDHGVYAGIPGEPQLLGELASRPIAGFKVYPSDLRSPALREALKLRRLVILHPETPEASRGDLASFEPASRAVHRGCWWEALAVLELASIAPRWASVHVTHASCPSTIEAARGLGYTVDVTPHHLFYEALPGLDPCLYRVNPPLRGHAERVGLLKLLLEGRVDAVASDHAPHTPREKALPPTCPAGFPWLEAWPWMLFRLVRAGALSLGEFHWLVSRGPALVLGLRNYGELSVGARANVVVYDPKTPGRFPGPRHSKARLYPAFMAETAGQPIEVVVGGNKVYFEGELAEAPQGAVNPFKRRSRGPRPPSKN